MIMNVAYVSIILIVIDTILASQEHYKNWDIMCKGLSKWTHSKKQGRVVGALFVTLMVTWGIGYALGGSQGLLRNKSKELTNLFFSLSRQNFQA